MPEPKDTQPQTIYIPPPPAHIADFAYDVCEATNVDEPEIRAGFTQFMQVVASILARHLTEGGSFDNEGE